MYVFPHTTCLNIEIDIFMRLLTSLKMGGDLQNLGDVYGEWCSGSAVCGAAWSAGCVSSCCAGAGAVIMAAAGFSSQLRQLAAGPGTGLLPVIIQQPDHSHIRHQEPAGNHGAWPGRLPWSAQPGIMLIWAFI